VAGPLPFDEVRPSWVSWNAARAASGPNGGDHDERINSRPSHEVGS